MSELGRLQRTLRVGRNGTLTVEPENGKPVVVKSELRAEAGVTFADGTTQTSAASGSETNFADGEVPTDNEDGTYTLAHTPAAGSVKVYLNGVRQKAVDDYTVTSGTIDFGTYPLPGDGEVIVDYRH